MSLSAIRYLRAPAELQPPNLAEAMVHIPGTAVPGLKQVAGVVESLAKDGREAHV